MLMFGKHNVISYPIITYYS